MSAEPHEILKRYWGYDGFRSRQGEIVTSVLQGQDTLALLPTGGGKSVCFQVPALCMPGICVVISPLLALMEDQVSQLKRRGIEAVSVNSSMSKREADRILDNCVYGNIKFLYVSPERLKNEVFIERFKKMKVNLLAVDEAHCISQWGYDFRPSYLEIANIRQYHPNVPVLALTASATPEVVDDIQLRLQFSSYNVIGISFARGNLSYVVRHTEDKENKLVQICQSLQGSGIVYCGTRLRTKEVAAFLERNGISATYYHAGLSIQERKQQADLWFSNKCRVICATNAFGMGIDKPDVRFVLHADLPANPENYFQEAGRAGRDGIRAFAGLLWRESDIEMLHEQIEKRYPSKEVVRSVYRYLCNAHQIAIGAGKDIPYPYDTRQLCSTHDVDAATFTYAIQLLELSGHLSLIEGGQSSSRLHFPVNKQQLYSYQVANPGMDVFIQTILRMYGGLFDSFVAIREFDIARSMNLPQAEVVKRLQVLDNNGIVAYEVKGELPTFTLLSGRQNDQQLIIPKEVYEWRKERDQERAEAMHRYVSRNVCRSVQLLEYFGEKDATPCGHCDVCKETPQQKLVSEEFEEITEAIEDLIIERSYSIKELALALNRPIETITEVVRWHLDNGMWHDEITELN